MDAQAYPGLEVAHHSQANKHGYIESQPNPPELLEAENTIRTAEKTESPKVLDRMKRLIRNRRFLLILFTIIILAAIIGGAVGGTVHKRHSTSNPEGAQPSSNATTNSTNGLSGSLPTGGPQQKSVCRGGMCSPAIFPLAWPGLHFVCALAPNKSLMYNFGFNNSRNSTWSDSGLKIISAPAVVSSSIGHARVFGVQDDRSLYSMVIMSNGSRGALTKLQSTWGGPIAAFETEGAYAVYGPMPNETLQEFFSWSGATGFWNMSAEFTGTPATVALEGGQKIVLARGNDNALWYRFLTGKLDQWTPWTSLGGKLSSSPVIYSSGTNKMDAFALGSEGNLCWIGFRTQWLSWLCMDKNMTFQSVPSAVVVTPRRIDIIGLATDDHVYHTSLVDLNLGPSWNKLGGPLNSAPVLTVSDNMVYVYGIALDKKLYVSGWDASGFILSASSGWKPVGGEFLSIL